MACIASVAKSHAGKAAPKWGGMVRGMAVACIGTMGFAVLHAGCGRQDPATLVRGGYDESEMSAAISRARAEVDTFVAALTAGDGDSFAVKIAVSDGGETEHFWLIDVVYANDAFQGTIGNEPGIVRNVKFGESRSVNRAEISDWMIVRGGRIHGGYTIDPLLPTMPPEQAAAMRRQLVRTPPAEGGR